jgi:predicted ATP-grasp superfamily ATP-dependent carboligase
MEKSVLLTNSLQRKTLAAARSLGKRVVKVFSAEETVFTPSAFSKYCSKALVYPSLIKDKKLFLSWLINNIKEHSIDVVFPMDDDTLGVIIDNRAELEELAIIPLPPTDSYMAASDKWESFKLSQKAGVECAHAVKPNAGDRLEEITSQMSYPLIVKPRRSSGSRGMAIANSKDELAKAYESVHARYPCPMIQEYMGQGERFDVCLLYDKNSRLKASFVQKEIRHFPIEMGPSTMQQSVIYPELVEKAHCIMKSLNWYGVAELEFMVDSRDGKIKFMEINPRFWGSLHLSIIAGVDFPWMLYQLAVGNNIQEVHDYKDKIFCRWLLPGDILHYIKNKERKKS